MNARVAARRMHGKRPANAFHNNVAARRGDTEIPTDVAPGVQFQNTADVDWTSMAGSPAQAGTNTLAYERTGDTSDPGGTANDHNAQAIETIVVDPAELDKLFIGTSFADPTTAGRDVTIGEVVDFAIPIDLPESEIDTIAMVDFIPTGTTIFGTPQIITSASDPLITSDFNGTLSSTNTLATSFGPIPALFATWGDAATSGDETVVVADGN
ncbi:MAG: hypothetical protein IH969_04435, partial [Candidatus Krumholzibacteriota bacterium]|nr:hypothetical protein [Candidatus Krumholzibacteriota bacterium]